MEVFGSVRALAIRRHVCCGFMCALCEERFRKQSKKFWVLKQGRLKIVEVLESNYGVTERCIRVSVGAGSWMLHGSCKCYTGGPCCCDPAPLNAQKGIKPRQKPALKLPGCLHRALLLVKLTLLGDFCFNGQRSAAVRLTSVR